MFNCIKLRTFVTENEIEAAFVISGTGDVTRANLQFPNKMLGNGMTTY